MTCPQLPAELINEIIGHLHGDKRALAACTTVCKDWTYTARCHLFADSGVLNEQGLDRLLESCPVAIPFIRNVHLVGSYFLQDAYAQCKFDRVTSLSVQHFRWIHFTASDRTFITTQYAAIVRLKLNWGEFRDLHKFADFFCSFPCLETAIVINLQTARYPGTQPRNLPLPPKLRCLEWRSAHTTAILNWLTASEIRASLRTFHIDARDLRDLSAINNFLADVDIYLEEFLFTTSVFPDPGWLIDLSQNTNLRRLTIELRHLPGSPNDCLWLTQMLSQIVSVHLQEIRLQIVWGASHVGPYFLDWRGMDEVLVRPQFANLKKVTVAAQHGIQFLQRPAFPDWVRAQLSGCYSRQILFINDS